MSASAAAEASLPPAQPVWRLLLSQRMFVAGLVLIALIALPAMFADWVAPFEPFRMQFRLRFRPPAAPHWLGTDNFGRDVLSRLLHGARLSLAIGLGTVVLTGIVGTLVGLIAGWFRRLDGMLMRLMDALMAFPAILLALAIAAALGPSARNAIVALSVAYAPRVARTVRAAVLVLREQDYIRAARAFGANDGWIIARHLLPNALPPLIVQLTFVFAYALLVEAVLSFLGLGPAPPTATLGNMVAEAKDLIREAWWMSTFPGLAIAVLVLGLNLMGDGLREILDPRLRVQP